MRTLTCPQPICTARPIGINQKLRIPSTARPFVACRAEKMDHVDQQQEIDIDRLINIVQELQDKYVALNLCLK